MEKIRINPTAPPPVFGTTLRVVKEQSGGFTSTLYLNLRNQTLAEVTVWAREPQFGMAALEAMAQKLAQSVSPIQVVKPGDLS